MIWSKFKEMGYLTKEEEINLIKNEIILLETECIRPMREWLNYS